MKQSMEANEMIMEMRSMVAAHDKKLRREAILEVFNVIKGTIGDEAGNQLIKQLLEVIEL